MLKHLAIFVKHHAIIGVGDDTGVRVDPGDGLIHAVAEMGTALTHHFPRRPTDKNELSDEVSLG